MTPERMEGDKPRYKISSPGFDELLRKSEHWERIFPEILEFRRKEQVRIELEASSIDEKRRMIADSIAAEFEAVPEYGRRIFEDVNVDVLDEMYESRLGLYYLYLFGLMKPLERTIKDGKRAIDWEKAFDLTS